MIYFIAFIIVYALHVILRLYVWTTAALLAYAMIMVRQHEKRYQKAKENQKRFHEVSMYLDTLLYSFVKEEKAGLAMQDVSQTLPEGRMKQVAEQVVDYIQMTFDETEVLEEALAMIEREYPCQRIHTVHQFMSHVEYYGGEIEKPVNLLLADKSRWEKRIKETIAQRKKQLTDVILSVAAALAICGAVVHLPVKDMDISSEWAVQAVSLLVIIINDCIILKAQDFLTTDWIQMRLSEDEDYYVEKMENYQNFDDKGEKRRSMLLGGISLGLTAVCFAFGMEWQVVLLLLASLFFMNQHRIGKNLLQRNLVREIKYQFPNWLLDLVLLLQSENVHVALQKSKEHVPGVLRKELYLLTERLEMQPEASEPYHMFLQQFAIPEVHAAMGILYSLSIGNSGNADKQMSELVEKNLEMLDVTETVMLKDSSSGMYLLFLLPVMTASFKLVVDMVFLLLRFIAMPGGVL